MNKIESRKHLLNSRKNYNVTNCSKNVVNNIIKSKIIEKYNHIAIYYPIGKELDITSLVKIYQDKNFYLPITKSDLSFVLYKHDDPLYSGPFNTKEPKGEEKNINEIECFLIPCVGISIEKKRIGYGKGFYDRALANYKGTKIGIAYKEACSIDTEMDEYDIILDYIITEDTND